MIQKGFMANPHIAAILPAFNEEKTVANVVKPLVASQYIREVLVISDGSTDRTMEVAKAAGANVHQLPVNRGKGGAMLHALGHTDAPIIGFFDADLKGFTEEHVERLVQPVINGSRIMNVGLRDRGWPWTAIGSLLPLISGERVMHRQVLEGIPPKFLKGFMIESSLNYYCRTRKYAYGAVVLSGLSIRRKFEKVGYVRGVIEYILMFYQVIKAVIGVRIARLRGKF